MLSRRQVLAAGAISVLTTAGCSSSEPTGGSNGTERSTTRSDTQNEPTRRTQGTDDSRDGRRLQVTVAHGDKERDLFTGDAVESVGDVRQAESSGYVVPITLTDQGSTAVTDTLDEAGAFETPSEYTIVTYLGGERLTAATLGESLASVMEAGEWEGSLVVGVADRATAEEVQVALGSE